MTNKRVGPIEIDPAIRSKAVRYDSPGTQNDEPSEETEESDVCLVCQKNERHFAKLRFEGLEQKISHAKKHRDRDRISFRSAYDQCFVVQKPKNEATSRVEMAEKEENEAIYQLLFHRASHLKTGTHPSKMIQLVKNVEKLSESGIPDARHSMQANEPSKSTENTSRGFEDSSVFRADSLMEHSDLRSELEMESQGKNSTASDAISPKSVPSQDLETKAGDCSELESSRPIDQLSDQRSSFLQNESMNSSILSESLHEHEKSTSSIPDNLRSSILKKIAQKAQRIKESPNQRSVKWDLNSSFKPKNSIQNERIVKILEESAIEPEIQSSSGPLERSDHAYLDKSHDKTGRSPFQADSLQLARALVSKHKSTSPSMSQLPTKLQQKTPNLLESLRSMRPLNQDGTVPEKMEYLTVVELDLVLKDLIRIAMEEETFECPTCDVNFTVKTKIEVFKRKIVKHVLSHFSKPSYQCTVCERPGKDFTVHWQRHHRKQPQPGPEHWIFLENTIPRSEILPFKSSDVSINEVELLSGPENDEESLSFADYSSEGPANLDLGNESIFVQKPIEEVVLSDDEEPKDDGDQKVSGELEEQDDKRSGTEVSSHVARGDTTDVSDEGIQEDVEKSSLEPDEQRGHSTLDQPDESIMSVLEDSQDQSMLEMDSKEASFTEKKLEGDQSSNAMSESIPGTELKDIIDRICGKAMDSMKFKCPNCEKEIVIRSTVTAFRLSVKRHILQEISSKPYRCSLCGMYGLDFYCHRDRHHKKSKSMKWTLRDDLEREKVASFISYLSDGEGKAEEEEQTAGPADQNDGSLGSDCSSPGNLEIADNSCSEETNENEDADSDDRQSDDAISSTSQDQVVAPDVISQAEESMECEESSSEIGPEESLSIRHPGNESQPESSSWGEFDPSEGENSSRTGIETDTGSEEIAPQTVASPSRSTIANASPDPSSKAKMKAASLLHTVLEAAAVEPIVACFICSTTLKNVNPESKSWIGTFKTRVREHIISHGPKSPFACSHCDYTGNGLPIYDFLHRSKNHGGDRNVVISVRKDAEEDLLKAIRESFPSLVPQQEKDETSAEDKDEKTPPTTTPPMPEEESPAQEKEYPTTESIESVSTEPQISSEKLNSEHEPVLKKKVSSALTHAGENDKSHSTNFFLLQMESLIAELCRESQQGRRVKCFKCRTNFKGGATLPKMLRRHLFLHFKDKAYRCQICNFEGKNYKAHKLSAHRNEVFTQNDWQPVPEMTDFNLEILNECYAVDEKIKEPAPIADDSIFAPYPVESEPYRTAETPLDSNQLENVFGASEEEPNVEPPKQRAIAPSQAENHSAEKLPRRVTIIRSPGLPIQNGVLAWVENKKVKVTNHGSLTKRIGGINDSDKSLASSKADSVQTGIINDGSLEDDEDLSLIGVTKRVIKLRYPETPTLPTKSSEVAPNPKELELRINPRYKNFISNASELIGEEIQSLKGVFCRLCGQRFKSSLTGKKREEEREWIVMKANRHVMQHFECDVFCCPLCNLDVPNIIEHCISSHPKVSLPDKDLYVKETSVIPAINTFRECYPFVPIPSDDREANKTEKTATDQEEPKKEDKIATDDQESAALNYEKVANDVAEAAWKEGGKLPKFCMQCGVSFPKGLTHALFTRVIKEHALSHLNEMPFKCPICLAGVTNISDHYIRYHEDEKIPENPSVRPEVAEKAVENLFLCFPISNMT